MRWEREVRGEDGYKLIFLSIFPQKKTHLTPVKLLKAALINIYVLTMENMTDNYHLTLQSPLTAFTS